MADMPSVIVFCLQSKQPCVFDSIKALTFVKFSIYFIIKENDI